LGIFEIFFSTDLFSNEKVAEGLLTSAGKEPQVQGQTSSPAGRLIGRDHFLYRIPATHAKLKVSALMSHVCRQKQAPNREDRKKMHNNVLSKM
jgi:hypothetical protein